MVEKISTLVLKVDLNCYKCYNKIRKILCKFYCEIKGQTYDEKNNTVTIYGPFDPIKFSKKLKCKAGDVIKSIDEIKDNTTNKKQNESKKLNTSTTKPTPTPKPEPKPTPETVVPSSGYPIPWYHPGHDWPPPCDNAYGRPPPWYHPGHDWPPPCDNAYGKPQGYFGCDANTPNVGDRDVFVTEESQPSCTIMLIYLCVFLFFLFFIIF